VAERVTFTVGMDLPAGATVAEAKNFLESAIRAACTFEVCTLDPFARLDRSSISVMQQRQR
jgi:hypothetical protein